MKRDLFSRGIQMTIYFLLVGSLTLIHANPTYAQTTNESPHVLDSTQLKSPAVNDTVEVVIEKMKMKWLKIGAAAAVVPASLPFVMSNSSAVAGKVAALPSAKMPAPPVGGGGGGGGGSGGGGGGSTTYPPPAPNATLTATPYCGYGKVTRSSNPPSWNIKWYWQTSYNGTSKTNGTSSITVYSPGYVYLRAFDENTAKWSGYISKYASIKTKPSTPGTITVSNQCGKTVLTRPNPPSGVTYYWQSSSGGTSTSNYSETVDRTYGSSYFLRARSSNGCWSSAKSVGYSVRSVPATPGTIVVSNQCGQSLLTRPDPPSGITYYWQSSNSGTNTSSSSKTITRTSGSVYYLKARNNSSLCWSSARSVNYSIKAIPSLASGSNNSRCGSGLITLTASPGSNGNTIRWYTAASGGTLKHTGTSYTFDLTGDVTYYAASYNSSTGCIDSDRRAITADYKALPAIYSVGGGGNYCAGGNGRTITLSGSQVGVTYSLYNGGSLVQTEAGNGGIINFNNQTAEGNNYTVQASLNGCSVPMGGFATITIDPIPSIASGSDVSRCGDGSITLNASPGANGNEIKWYTTASGGSPVHTGSAYTFNLTSDITYYAASYNTATTCEAADRKAILADYIDLPEVYTVSGGGDYCAGESGMTVSLGNSQSGATYTLYKDGSTTGQTMSGTGLAIDFGGVTGTGDYTIQATLNGCEIGMSGTARIDERPIPELASGSAASRCNAGTLDLTATPGTHGDNIRWYDAAVGGNLLHTGLTFTTPALSANTTYYAASLNEVFGCEDVERTAIEAQVNSIELASGADVSRCGAGAIQLSATPGTGGDDVQWFTASTGGIPIQTGASLDVSDLSATTTYYAATYNTTNGCTDDQRVAITATVHPLPADFTVTGGNHCTDDGTLSIGLSGSEADATYQLNLDGSTVAGVTKAGTGAAITFDQAQTAVGTYTVTATNANCSLDMSGSAVIIQSPQIPVLSGGGAYCEGGLGVTVDLSVAETGASYELFKDGLTTGQTTSNTTFGNQTEAGAYTVKTTKDGCTSDLVETVNVLVNPKPAQPQFDVSTNLCSDKTVSVLNPPAEGGAESWTWQGSVADGFDNTAFSSHVISASGSYYVRAHENVNGCWSDPVEIPVVVNPIPLAPTATFVETNHCGNTEITRNEDPPVGWTWYWQVAETDEVTDAAHAQPSFTMNTGSTLYLRSRSDAGCWSPAQSINYSIHAIPAEPAVTVDVMNECGKSTLTPQSSAPAGYSWYWEETSDGTTGLISSAAVERTSGTEYFLRAKDDTNGCWSTAKTVSYEIKTVPAQPTALAPVKSCGSTELTMDAVPGGETWYWQPTVDGMDDTNSATSIQRTSGTTYYLRARNDASLCWSEALAINYSIDEIPIVVQPTIENLCGETRMVKPVDASGFTYRWEAPEGQNLPEGVTTTSASFLMEIYEPLRIRATNQSTGCTDVADVTYTITPIPYVKSSNDKNFVMAVSVQEEGVKSDVNIGCYQNQIKVDYFDGLGRMMQTVVPSGSPLRDDIVQAYAYDAYGRQEREFLPYAKPTDKPGAYVGSAITEQLNFYTNATNNVVEDQKPWIQHQFEKSPLNRVLETYGAGQDWQGTGETPSGHSTQMATLTNENGEVLIWEIDETNGLPVRKKDAQGDEVYYAENTLLLNELVTDATNNVSDDQVVHEYKDSRGLTVLKRVKVDANDWLDTYYIYDDWGSVVMVLPPVLSDMASPTMDDANHLAFAYQYDEKRRIKAKKLPGTGIEDASSVNKVSELPGWHEMVYDQWDRIVLTQDPNQTDAGEYLVTKYDALNRPIITGLFANNQSAEHWRTNLSTGQRFETRQSNALGYSSSTSPSLDDTYSVTYYDDYAFINYPGWHAEGLSYAFVPETGFDSQAFQAVKGQSTGSKVKVLGSDTDQWLNTVTYYDDKYRVLQTITENIRGGQERVTFAYDFAGKVLKSLHVHTNNGGVSILKEFEYDKAGRLLKTWHTINTQPRVLMVENQYNEAGELIEKNLHSENEGTEFMQSLDYRYNIRGWLTHINQSQLDGEANVDGDLFGMQLAYTDNPTVGSHAIKPRYDGNISSIRWSTDNHVDPRKEQIFGYDYDLANRLKTARYASGSPGNWTGDAGHYDVEIGEYDKNGNIRSLNRQGNGTALDQLTYAYKNGQLSNKLKNLTEAADNELGFMDAAKDYTSDDYNYDANGNMIFDANKDIHTIVYNHLNLPVSVEFIGGNKIRFMYDATGVKVRKEVYEAGNALPISTTDYTAMGQYQDEELEFLFTDEGRALPGPVPGTFEYEYFLKDHLGNNRVAFGMLIDVDYYHATMETANPDIQSYEEANFENLSTRLEFEVYNKTQVTAEVTAPKTVANVRNGVGPSIVLEVKQGDKIAASVYGAYPIADAGNGGVPVQNFAALVASSFGVTAGGETQQVYQAFQDFLPIAGAAGLGQETRPRGYLNIIIFNEDYTDARYAMKEIGTEGFQNMQLLERELIAEFDGTVYIYVANESNASTADILFDEFSITHTKGEKNMQVTQSSDFYPFGMKMQPASYQHKGHNVNKYNFQGQEEVADHNLNWHQFKWRNHDPAIGRFFNIDPLAEDYIFWSPYIFSGNMITNNIELEGLEPTLPEYLWKNSNGYKYYGNGIHKVQGYWVHGANDSGANFQWQFHNGNGWEKFTPTQPKPLAPDVKRVALTSILVAGGSVSGAALMESGGAYGIQWLAREYGVKNVGDFLANASLDAFNQMLVKGDLRDVDIANVIVSGIIKKESSAMKNLLASLFDYSYNNSDGSIIKDDALDFGAEFIVRTIADDLFKKYIDAETAGKKAMTDYFKKQLRGKVYDYYRELRGTEAPQENTAEN